MRVLLPGGGLEGGLEGGWLGGSFGPEGAELAGSGLRGSTSRAPLACWWWSLERENDIPEDNIGAVRPVVWRMGLSSLIRVSVGFIMPWELGVVIYQ